MKKLMGLFIISALSACGPAQDNTNNPEHELKSPHFSKIGEGDITNFPGHDVRHHVRNDTLPSSVSLLELSLGGKSLGAPPHIHEDEDEIFIILDGKVHFLSGTDEVIAEAGTVASLPRGHFHGFWNPYEESATMVLIIAPGHFESFFQSVEQAVMDGDEKTPQEIGAIIAQKAVEQNVSVDMSRLPQSGLMLLQPPAK